MTKKYIEELAEWVKDREASKPTQDKHVVAFLAVKGDVEDAITAGYSLRTIWTHLHEVRKISVRYETFLRHVRRLVKTKPSLAVIAATPQHDGRPPEPGQPSPSPAAKKRSSRPAAKATGFNFDSSPNKEDLL